jgi:hypothetical protein
MLALGMVILCACALYVMPATALGLREAIEKGGELTAELTKVASFDTVTVDGVYCHVVQGGGTDGKNVYVALVNGNNDASTKSVILKFDPKTWEILQTSGLLLLQHANDITYNPNLNSLVVACCEPNYRKIVYVSPDSLEETGSASLRTPTYCLAYDAEKDCYWTARDMYYAAVPASDLKKVLSAGKHDTTGHTTQGMTVDEKYLYFVLYKENCMMIYDKETGKQTVVGLSVPASDGEPENLFWIDGEMYIVFNNSTWTGGEIYKVADVSVK